MITLVYAAPERDWVAVYRDGKLVDQGHSFDEDELLDLVEVDHETIYDGDAHATGRFPQSLEDVVRESETPKLTARMPDVNEKVQTEDGVVKRWGDWTADDLRAAVARLMEEAAS